MAAITTTIYTDVSSRTISTSANALPGYGVTIVVYEPESTDTTGGEAASLSDSSPTTRDGTVTVTEAYS